VWGSSYGGDLSGVLDDLSPTLIDFSLPVSDLSGSNIDLSPLCPAPAMSG
jgi:hypothetical protein